MSGVVPLLPLCLHEGYRKNFIFLFQCGWGLLLERDTVSLAGLFPTFRKNVIPPSLSSIPWSWKMKVLCIFEKTQAAAPNSPQLHVLHKLKCRFIAYLYVIKTCCVLTRRNGNLVWVCIYFKTKLSAVINVLYYRLMYFTTDWCTLLQINVLYYILMYFTTY
jgi:hypothetical protein